MIGNHLDVIHAVSPAPALLRKREIHAERVNLHVRQLAGFFIKSLGLGVANGSIERRHHAENSHAGPGARQIEWFEGIVYRMKIGGCIAGLQFRANHRHGIASYSCCSWSLYILFHMLYCRRSSSEAALVTGS